MVRRAMLVLLLLGCKAPEQKPLEVEKAAAPQALLSAAAIQVPLATFTSVKVNEVSDTTLQVITTWRYNNTPANKNISQVIVRNELITPVAKEFKRNTWAIGRGVDTSFAPTSAYGTISGRACVAGLRGVKRSDWKCDSWKYVRMAPPEPPDTVNTEVEHAVAVVVRPKGMQVSVDSVGSARCSLWEKNNPHKSVWNTVNKIPVPACLGVDNLPIVAQFCALAKLNSGKKILTTNSSDTLLAWGLAKEAEYCKQQLESWKAEVSG